ncbi:MAG: hypothetical protein GF311_22455 [Candidatus Lokiarchaeota archaeon]|nr:hypothetical protein [Candidatus Lokiarchaeota archaeon]
MKVSQTQHAQVEIPINQYIIVRKDLNTIGIEIAGTKTIEIGSEGKSNGALEESFLELVSDFRCWIHDDYDPRALSSELRLSILYYLENTKSPFFRKLVKKEVEYSFSNNKLKNIKYLKNNRLMDYLSVQERFAVFKEYEILINEVIMELLIQSEEDLAVYLIKYFGCQSSSLTYLDCHIFLLLQECFETSIYSQWNKFIGIFLEHFSKLSLYLAHTIKKFVVDKMFPLLLESYYKIIGGSWLQPEKGFIFFFELVYLAMLYTGDLRKITVSKEKKEQLRKQYILVQEEDNKETNIENPYVIDYTLMLNSLFYTGPFPDFGVKMSSWAKEVYFPDRRGLIVELPTLTFREDEPLVFLDLSKFTLSARGKEVILKIAGSSEDFKKEFWGDLMEFNRILHSLSSRQDQLYHLFSLFCVLIPKLFRCVIIDYREYDSSSNSFKINPRILEQIDMLNEDKCSELLNKTLFAGEDFRVVKCHKQQDDFLFVFLRKINKDQWRSSVYKINELLTLRLEDENTNIYVNGKLFSQCKYLLLTFASDEAQKYDEIGSIDELSDYLDNSLEGTESGKYEISPSTEFWGHCSNLQAWVEHNYDTRLLHSNIAFPLLKELADQGDQEALKVFKDEIAIRFEEGYEPTLTILLEGGYLNYLSEQEKKCVYETNLRKLQRIIQEWFRKDSTRPLVFIMIQQFSYPLGLCKLLPDDPSLLHDLDLRELDDLLYFKHTCGQYKKFGPFAKKWESFILTKIFSEFSILFKDISLSYNPQLETLYEFTLSSLRCFFPHKMVLMKISALINKIKTFYKIDESSRYRLKIQDTSDFFSYAVYDHNEMCYFDSSILFQASNYHINDFVDLSYYLFEDYRTLITSIAYDEYAEFLEDDENFGFIRCHDCRSANLDKKFKSLLVEFSSVCRSFKVDISLVSRVAKKIHSHLISCKKETPKNIIFSLFCALDVFMRGMYNWRYLEVEDFDTMLREYYVVKKKYVKYTINKTGFKYFDLYDTSPIKSKLRALSEQVDLTSKKSKKNFFNELSTIFFPEGDEKIVGISSSRGRIRLNTRILRKP